MNFTIGPSQFPTPEPTQRPSMAPTYILIQETIIMDSSDDDTHIITEYQDVIIPVTIGAASLLIVAIGFWCIYRHCRVNKYEIKNTTDRENETDEEIMETAIHDTDEELVHDTV